MATIQTLAPRVLRKLGVLDAQGSPPAEDQALAEAKLRAVHASLKIKDVVQWTLNDIPDYAEEPYVSLAAVLAAPEFGRKHDPNWKRDAMAEIYEGVSLRYSGPVWAEYY